MDTFITTDSTRANNAIMCNNARIRIPYSNDPKINDIARRINNLNDELSRIAKDLETICAYSSIELSFKSEEEKI